MPSEFTVGRLQNFSLAYPNGSYFMNNLYIHGVGRTRARQILVDLKMENKITKDMSEEELITIRDEVSKYMIEGDLRRFNALAIRRLKEIQCYRGIRHIQGLPCRGQHTKNNCRTLKGKRVAIAGKKKAPR
ncbi:30S ribosomal protein S13 [Citrus sinensis]|nr:30S ribosomal protein S13 [Citrus sinensis]